MAKQLVATVVSVFTALVLQSCATSAGHDVGNGCIYSSVEGPTAPGPGHKKTKTGKACASNILGIIATGDNSINTAQKVGGVTKIASVDYDRMNILMLYSKVCTIVRGE